MFYKFNWDLTFAKKRQDIQIHILTYISWIYSLPCFAWSNSNLDLVYRTKYRVMNSLLVSVSKENYKLAFFYYTLHDSTETLARFWTIYIYKLNVWFDIIKYYLVIGCNYNRITSQIILWIFIFILRICTEEGLIGPTDVIGRKFWHEKEAWIKSSALIWFNVQLFPFSHF